jgi:hypothetical protein
MPVGTRSTEKEAAANKKQRTNEAGRARHLSDLDSDALTHVMLAFVNDAPSAGEHQIKKMGTLRGVCKNFAEFFAKRVYDMTATVMFTKLAYRDDEEPMERSCAINMNCTAHVMFKFMIETCPPAPCFLALKLLERFGGAPSGLERRKLLCMGMGVPREDVEQHALAGRL